MTGAWFIRAPFIYNFLNKTLSFSYHSSRRGVKTLWYDNFVVIYQVFLI